MIASKHILILEDDPLISMDFEDELSDRGYDPISATTVANARSQLKRQKPSFAFLDMHLRSETSFDFARELRERNVPFAFVSGNDESSLPEDLKSSKILTKPIDFDEMNGLIAETENDP